MTGGAGSAQTLWRYKHNDQQAARDGDWKYLKILDNCFLFDVVQDPMERANLKERERDGTNGLSRNERGERKDAAARSAKLHGRLYWSGLADHFGVR